MKVKWSDFGPLPNYERCVRFDIGGVVGIIIIHNTTLGPALGGFRVKDYGSEAEMIADVARLARGMSYKNAGSDFELGGGKAAMNAAPCQITVSFLKRYGEIVEALKGKYITAPDFGSNVAMMDVISLTTKFVDCLSEKKGGLGDPSPSTARGIFLAIQAAEGFVPSFKRISTLRVLIQGYGKVGQPLAQMLKNDGYSVLVAEIAENQRHLAEQDGCELVLPEKAFQTPAHIFAPCATGGILHPETIRSLKEAGIKLICGGANNQLQDEERDPQLLRKARIWWVPDFIANAGGVAIAYTEWQVRSGEITREQAADCTEQRLQRIARRCQKIMMKAEDGEFTSLEAARKLAEDTVAKRGGKLC